MKQVGGRVFLIRHPLLRIDGLHDPARFAESSLAITDDGQRVLDGEGDFVDLNGIDCWYGGVHLQGMTTRRRWNEAAECVVRVPGF